MLDKELLHVMGTIISHLTKVSLPEDLQEEVSDILIDTTMKLAQAIEKNETGVTDNSLTPENLEEIAVLATEFDASGDPLLQKQASVLDQILLTIGSPRNGVTAFKQAEEKEIERLREKYTQEAR